MEHLSGDQQVHVAKIRDIISVYDFWREISDKGTGKTRTTTAVSVLSDLELFVVCPASIVSNWQEEAALQGAKVVDVMSYERLRFNRSANHPYLSWDQAMGTYYVKESFLDLLRERPLLVVFDEVQNIKRDSTNNLQACHAIACAIAENNARATRKSKIALISASPYESNEFAINTARAAGIIKTRAGANESLVVCLNELKAYCMKIDTDKTNEICRQFRIRGTGKLEDCIADLIQHVVGPCVNACMDPIQSIHEHIFENKYYKLNDDDHKRALEANANRRRLVGCKRFQATKETSSNIDKNYFTETEAAKLKDLSIDIKSVLLEEPTSKVIVYMWSLMSFDTMTELLSDYPVLIYNGQVKPHDRDKVRELFQRPTTEYRVLLANPKVGGIGTSFDDTHGGFPRRVWAIPNDHFQTLFQSESRHLRRTTKSNTRFIMAYAEGIPYENEVKARLEAKRLKVAQSIGYAYPIRDITSQSQSSTRVT